MQVTKRIQQAFYFNHHNDMTPEEKHNYNRMWSISGISYEAVCTDDAIIAFRTWIERYLEMAYDAGYNNAKKGEL